MNGSKQHLSVYVSTTTKNKQTKTNAFPLFLLGRIILTASNKDDTFLLWCRAVYYIHQTSYQASTFNRKCDYYPLSLFFYFFYREKNSRRRLFPIAVQQVKYNAAVFYYLFIFPLHSHIERVTQYDRRRSQSSWNEKKKKTKMFSLFFFKRFYSDFIFWFYFSVEWNLILCSAAQRWSDMTWHHRLNMNSYIIWPPPLIIYWVATKVNKRRVVQYRNPTNRVFMLY